LATQKLSNRTVTYPGYEGNMPRVRQKNQVADARSHNAIKRALPIQHRRRIDCGTNGTRKGRVYRLVNELIALYLLMRQPLLLNFICLVKDPRDFVGSCWMPI
jgi:hypothetical protein